MDQRHQRLGRVEAEAAVADQADAAGRKPCKSYKADARIRTADPFITSEVLYQLSYVGGARLV